MSGTVIDPVCGMEVDPATSAGSFEYKGTSFHFCSVRCLEKFKNAPDSFVTRRAPKPAEALPYTYPMHSPIRQAHPGPSPVGSMALEPDTSTHPFSKTGKV